MPGPAGLATHGGPYRRLQPRAGGGHRSVENDLVGERASFLEEIWSNNARFCRESYRLEDASWNSQSGDAAP